MEISLSGGWIAGIDGENVRFSNSLKLSEMSFMISSLEMKNLISKMEEALSVLSYMEIPLADGEIAIRIQPTPANADTVVWVFDFGMFGLLSSWSITINRDDFEKLVLFFKASARPSVFWIVSEGNEEGNGEFGVEINGVPYFYYKYSEASTSNSVKYRRIEKREFGEVIRKP